MFKSRRWPVVANVQAGLEAEIHRSYYLIFVPMYRAAQ